MGWINNYAQMLQISFLGYLASGMFLSMCYFDLFYHLVIITAVLKKLAAKSYEKERLPAIRDLQNSMPIPAAMSGRS